MTLYCTTTNRYLRTDWHSSWTDLRIRELLRQGGSLQPIEAHINTFFDAHIINPINRVCVTLNCQNPWPAVLVPVWHACGMSEEDAALFLGALFCRVAIKRPKEEDWWTSPLPIFRNRADPYKWTPRHYVLRLQPGQPKPKPRS
jgi:hypothetical protein